MLISHFLQDSFVTGCIMKRMLTKYLFYLFHDLGILMIVFILHSKASHTLHNSVLQLPILEQIKIWKPLILKNLLIKPELPVLIAVHMHIILRMQKPTQLVECQICVCTSAEKVDHLVVHVKLMFYKQMSGLFSIIKKILQQPKLNLKTDYSQMNCSWSSDSQGLHYYGKESTKKRDLISLISLCCTLMKENLGEEICEIPFYFLPLLKATWDKQKLSLSYFNPLNIKLSVRNNFCVFWPYFWEILNDIGCKSHLCKYGKDREQNRVSDNF